MMYRLDLTLIWTAFLAYALVMAISIGVGDNIGLPGLGVFYAGFVLLPWLIVALIFFTLFKPRPKTRRTQVLAVVIFAALSFVLAVLLFDAPNFTWYHRGIDAAFWAYVRIFAAYITLWCVLYLFFTRLKRPG